MGKARSTKPGIPVLFSMFLFIMILVPQLVLSGASANHYVKSLGVDRVKDEAILADYGYTSTQVSVNLAYGDKSDFRSPQVVNVLWDENAVVVALLVYHKMGIIDDKGNIVEAFVDARAGGVGVKTQDKCYLGPEVCYKYEVVEAYKAFRDYLLEEVTERYKLYIRASTEAEAKAEAKLRLI